jgi:radical SAM protein with 4Fe4S-binding SPASM domain
VRHWPIVIRKINKRIVQVQEIFIRNQHVFGQPFYLTLESGNSCNLRCPLCATTFRESSLPKGKLTLENATKIIDRFPALLVLNLSLWGEPFLNKQIFNIIKYARSKKIEVIIQSNFSLSHFDEQMAQSIIDSDLNVLWLSIDGASQETYEMYRRRGDYRLVIKNLELLRRLQMDQRKKYPLVTWKMVVNKFNEHEVNVAKDAAERMGVEFLAVEIYTPEHLKREWKPGVNINGFGVRTHTDRHDDCYQLWQVMTVNFNGDVFPCCGEWSPQDALGNVLREPVSRIWNSAEYRKRRANNKSGPPACDLCHIDKQTNYWRNWKSESGTATNPLLLPIVDPHGPEQTPTS